MLSRPLLVPLTPLSIKLESRGILGTALGGLAFTVGFAILALLAAPHDEDVSLTLGHTAAGQSQHTEPSHERTDLCVGVCRQIAVGEEHYARHYDAQPVQRRWHSLLYEPPHRGCHRELQQCMLLTLKGARRCERAHVPWEGAFRRRALGERLDEPNLIIDGDELLPLCAHHGASPRIFIAGPLTCRTQRRLSRRLGGAHESAVGAGAEDEDGCIPVHLLLCLFGGQVPARICDELVQPAATDERRIGRRAHQGHALLPKQLKRSCGG